MNMNLKQAAEEFDKTADSIESNSGCIESIVKQARECARQCREAAKFQEIIQQEKNEEIARLRKMLIGIDWW